MNENPESASAATTPGELLKRAREQAGSPIERVAKDLFLDVQAIKAIEANRFKDLGAPVYAKGYLRKYARLVGLNEEDILRRYAALSDVPGVADPIPVTLGSIPESRRPLPRWVLWLVGGVIVAAGLVTLLNLRSQQTNLGVQGELIAQPLPASTAVTNASAINSLAADGTETSVASSGAAGALALSFKFSGDSWVEVYDARNQQILYDMGTNNSSRAVTGTPPLRVVLGAAAGVSLKVNGQPITVPASHVEAGVARFTLNGNGQLE